MLTHLQHLFILKTNIFSLFTQPYLKGLGFAPAYEDIFLIVFYVFEKFQEV